ncbi:MAG: hypothetical protein M3Y56_11915 [Armatimonadota bacterium]|nr:hypothetical protein [Armatimonadota bacterium]
MAYRDFTLSDITRKFPLTLDERVDLFASTPDVAISAELEATLGDTVPLALAIHTEKARSEMIIIPILLELRRTLDRRMSLFSGVDFSVDAANGLNGVCDFIISASPEQLLVTAPILMMVEAKSDNIKAGLAQCIAEMIAAQIFNARNETGPTTIYGAVTTGTNWRFLKLEGTTVVVNAVEYYIDHAEKIMGILMQIVSTSHTVQH